MSAREHSLKKLLADMADAPVGVFVSDIVSDSRAATEGALFLALNGATHHGLDFSAQAVIQGARAIVYETPHAPPESVPSNVFVAAIERLRERTGTIASRFFADPSARLNVVGITGTNGKTTCAYLLAQALSRCGRRAAYAGTIGVGFPDALAATAHTTLDAVELQRQLAELREQGAECVAMEVSSHALDQHRVAGVRFAIAAFTNLTRDHLDYHGTMAAYGSAKARLFATPGLKNCVVNIDDDFGTTLAGGIDAARLIVTSRLVKPARGRFVRATSSHALSNGLAIEIESSWGATLLRVPLIGEFNVDNVLTVLAILLAWDIPLSAAAAALAGCRAPPGRMETIGGARGEPLAIVDYAHTPDALGKALHSARTHCRGALHVVFGCGGDRDRGKRPLMGGIAAELADRITLTDDNPRTESPARIVADIIAGLGSFQGFQVIHDRAEAIRAALRRAGTGDVVLVAGKGHEDYQIYGTERRRFSDQAVLRAAFDALRSDAGRDAVDDDGGPRAAEPPR